jgi:cysteinyl-tRNA synthetase
VERLRNFKRRLETDRWEPGSNAEIAALAANAVQTMQESLDDDLNTAQALAAIFDLVRDVNGAADQGKVKQDDIAAILGALGKFDEIFAVLADTDAAHVKAIVEWAKAEGLEEKISPAAAEMAKSAALSDAQVEALVAKHSDARKAKDFKTSDAVRDELLAQGIVLENTKDGVRWKRK